ncbi:MAG: family 20 glycosylhydrolase [Clostridia bacterium]|nr:family 20 glycosylhydrolase [Clostridia bacterium]
MFIVPNPQKIKINDGKLIIDSFSIMADEERIYDFTKELNTENGNINIVFKKVENKKNEEYSLCVSDKGILIEYSDLEGAFRASSTLKQIIKTSEGEINYMEIEDWPSIKNRGYMFDISAPKIPKMEYLKWLIDAMADLKYNQLQLYMESMVYEYKNFPQYWKGTDVLSKSEIEELDIYCKERFIKLVPTTNGFGHMKSWLAKEEINHLAITRDDNGIQTTINPLKKESLELVDKIYDGFIDAFSADMINIGMDEPFELGMGETKEACETEGKGKIYTDHLLKICDLAKNKYGKTPMFWDDVIFKYPEQLSRLPKDGIVMEWGYETEHYFDRYCAILKDKGIRYYVCPGSATWRSFTGRTDNMMFNVVAAAKSASFYDAEGLLMTEWGDPGHVHTSTVTYLPMALAAEFSWNSGSTDDIEACMERREAVANNLKYLDKYIFKSEGEASLADIIYRMGNYYFLENSVNCNATELSCCFTKPEVITEEMKPGFRRIIEYMKGLRKELDMVKADELCLREAKHNCDMVIFTAEMVLGKRDKAEAERMKKEHCELWRARNRELGIENYGNLIDVFFE